VLAHKPIAEHPLVLGNLVVIGEGRAHLLRRTAIIGRPGAVAENRSMPKRAMSNRGLPTAIISIAQQQGRTARHNEFFRAMLRTFATVVSKMPSGSFSSRPMTFQSHSGRRDAIHSDTTNTVR